HHRALVAGLEFRGGVDVEIEAVLVGRRPATDRAGRHGLFHAAPRRRLARLLPAQVTDRRKRVGKTEEAQHVFALEALHLALLEAEDRSRWLGRRPHRRRGGSVNNRAASAGNLRPAWAVREQQRRDKGRRSSNKEANARHVSSPTAALSSA